LSALIAPTTSPFSRICTPSVAQHAPGRLPSPTSTPSTPIATEVVTADSPGGPVKTISSSRYESTCSVVWKYVLPRCVDSRSCPSAPTTAGSADPEPVKVRNSLPLAGVPPTRLAAAAIGSVSSVWPPSDSIVVAPCETW